MKDFVTVDRMCSEEQQLSFSDITEFQYKCLHTGVSQVCRTIQNFRNGYGYDQEQDSESETYITVDLIHE